MKGPTAGERFGTNVDVNQQFMVSSCQGSSVYVYQSQSPYDMVTRFPVEGNIIIDTSQIVQKRRKRL